jgi:NADP-dependent 3-hydroxy acid dehydrogenase YdfG
MAEQRLQNMWTTKDIPNQKGKTVIVTGGNTSIGFETALALSRQEQT